MSSKSMGANGYGHNLDLLITLHLMHASKSMRGVMLQIQQHTSTLYGVKMTRWVGL